MNKGMSCQGTKDEKVMGNARKSLTKEDDKEKMRKLNIRNRWSGILLHQSLELGNADRQFKQTRFCCCTIPWNSGLPQPLRIELPAQQAKRT